MRRDVVRASAVLACVTAGAAIVACNLDVIVGEDPPATSLPEAGGTDASIDVVAADVVDHDTLVADASTEADAAPLESVLSAVALSDAGVVAAGHTGGTTGAEPTSDAWLGRLRADATEQSGRAVDTQNAADAARAAIAYGTSDWIAAGFATAAGGRRAWIRRLDTNDAAVWTLLLVPGDDAGVTSAEATSLARSSSQAIFVGGNESSASTLPDGFVVRVDGAGAIAWESRFRGTGAANTTVLAIGANDFEQTFAGGQRRVQDDGGAPILIPALVKLSNDGSVSNSSVAFGAPPGPGAIKGVLPYGGGSQESAVCVESGGDVWVSQMDLSLAPTKTQHYTDPRGPIVLGGCVMTNDDGILVVGTITAAAGAIPWAAKLQRSSFTPRWERSIATASPAHALAVAAEGSGGGWAVGYTSSPVRRWASTIAP